MERKFRGEIKIEEKRKKSKFSPNEKQLTC